MNTSPHYAQEDGLSKPMASGTGQSQILLTIKNIGTPVAFKNRKRICGNRLITRKDVKLWMKRAERSFVSQFVSLCQIEEGGTTMECLRRFLTRSLPRDDCWTELEIGSVKTELCQKGEEGCEILIERIQ